MSGYQGDYDASTFTDDPTTWPGPLTQYEPGQWWYVTAPGIVDGTAVDVGDRLYPTGRGRTYGELDYGDATYGGTISPPWPAERLRVVWVARIQSLDFWDQPAPPYGGCPLIGDWRLVVEVLTFDPQARRYGDGTYGSGVYGDAQGLSVGWSDMTPAAFGVSILRGATDGRPQVDVDQATIDVLDADGALFGMLTPVGSQPATLGTMLRVSVLDAASTAHALFAGRIETVEDVHDRPPRTLQVSAFGVASDLATVLDQFSGPTLEQASDRVERILSLAGWEWGGVPAFPAGDRALRSRDVVEQTSAREEVDRAALSAGWLFDTDSRGVARVRDWPLSAPDGVAAVNVTDRLNDLALPAVALDLVSDGAECLNVAAVESDAQGASPAISSTVSDPGSVSRVGRRSEALGFPLSGLSAGPNSLDELAQAASDRYSRIVNRCRSVEVDSLQDWRWVAVLADLTESVPVRITRTKPISLTLDALVCGIEHRITPGRWAATIHLTTTTPTFTS